jgi:hypothetical protein
MIARCAFHCALAGSTCGFVRRNSPAARSIADIGAEQPRKFDQFALGGLMQRGGEAPTLLATDGHVFAPQQRNLLTVLPYAAFAVGFRDGADILAGIINASFDQATCRVFP